MYSIITRWSKTSTFSKDSINDRYGHISKIQHNDNRTELFKQFLDAGLVDNVGGPNCYTNEQENYIESCNATWKSLEAAQEWFNLQKTFALVVYCELVDQDGNILDSFSN